MTYAAKTSVSTEKTKSEIEKLLVKHGATSVVTGWQGDRARVVFEMRDRRIRFDLPLPALESALYDTERKRPLSHREAARTQDHRARWRGLLLIVRAKLEAVETGCRTFDQEFALDTVLPDGMTLAERVAPRLANVLLGERLPPLLGSNS